MLIHYTAIWYIVWPFGIICGHSVYFVVIWYILRSFGVFCGDLVHLTRFGILYKEKSGSPASHLVIEAQAAELTNAS
jgi:hypothetical protein